MAIEVSDSFFMLPLNVKLVEVRSRLIIRDTAFCNSLS